MSIKLWVQAKWGELQNPMEICKVEVESALTGAKMLPQQPFGNLHYLQRSYWSEENLNMRLGGHVLRGLSQEPAATVQA